MLNQLKMFKRSLPVMPTVSSMANAEGGLNWIISIRGVITKPDMFATACDVLNFATEKDKVLVTLNTPGGSVIAGLAMIHAIYNCKAEVTTRAVGLVASCGGFLWSAGHKLEACRFAKIMFHASSSGYIGKTRDQRDAAICSEKLVKELATIAVNKKIVTREQFDSMFESNVDIYITTKDLTERGVEYAIA
jgi:ATP-dependent protease ClpP protease subunit